MSRQPKPFEPKDGAPGARLEWLHIYPDGHDELRAGTIWSDAPSTPGYGKPVWVIPDEHRDDDPYTAVVVARVAHQRLNVHAGVETDDVRHATRTQGQVISVNHPRSALGSLAAAAAAVGNRERRTAGNFTLTA